MLDVHPPESKIHNVGEFLLHLFTITIGLLIALGLEGLVERHHRAELREQAQSSLQQEITDNHKQIGILLPVLRTEQKTLVTVLQFLAARESGKSFDLGATNLGFTNVPLSDASWRTASATGALALMNYATAQRYAAIYQMQEQTVRLEGATLDDYLQIEAHSVYGFDPAKVSAEDARAGEPEVRHALAHIVAWQQFAEALDAQYAKALRAEK